MDVLTNLRTFLMVARCGGFSEAARKLHTVPSVTAKRVTQLEKTVGARLFVRSTRSTLLTEAGVQLQAKAMEVVGGFDDIVRGLRRDEDEIEGPIRVMAPTTLTLMCLSGVFSGFLRANPRVHLEIALVDRSSNPLEEGFDIAISGRSASFEGVIDVPLSSVHPVLCASPAYLEARGVPTHPRELMEHDCLVFKPSGSHWSFQGSAGDTTVDVKARLTADDNLTLLEVAKAGCGIAILPLYVAQRAIKSSELQTLLPLHPPQENWFKAYVPRRRSGLPRVKALLKCLKDELPERLRLLEELSVEETKGSSPERGRTRRRKTAVKKG
jgi:DNA-binding transcriptional LysR family regulator